MRGIKGLGKGAAPEPADGLAGWLLAFARECIARLGRQARRNGAQHAQPRLALIERIPLAPRQSLALVEAEGRRLLVATSADSGPVFYALDRAPGSASRRAGRISW